MGVPDIPKHHNRVVVEPGSVGAGKASDSMGSRLKLKRELFDILT